MWVESIVCNISVVVFSVVFSETQCSGTGGILHCVLPVPKRGQTEVN